MMSNAPGCTILLPLSDFVKKFIKQRRGFRAAFDAHFPSTSIEKISQQLRDLLVITARVPDDDDDENDEDEEGSNEASLAIEKDITRLWVRCSRHYFDHQTTDVDSPWSQAELDQTHRLCPGFYMNLSETAPQPGEPTRSKVDASFIPESDRDLTTPNVPNWDYQRFTLEFKRGGTKLEPFDDKHPDCPETDTLSRRKVRGQDF